MTQKKYKFIRIITSFVVAFTVALAVTADNYVFPIIIVLAAMLFMFLAKKQIREVIADERDYDLAGKASRYAMIIYAFLSFLAMMTLLAFKETNPYFESIATTLAYSVCFLLILYSLIFKYYEKGYGFKDDYLSIIAGIVILILLFVFGVRVLSGEDSWICENGQWVKHGNPNYPAPSIPCNK